MVIWIREGNHAIVSMFCVQHCLVNRTGDREELDRLLESLESS